MIARPVVDADLKKHEIMNIREKNKIKELLL